MAVLLVCKLGLRFCNRKMSIIGTIHITEISLNIAIQLQRMVCLAVMNISFSNSLGVRGYALFSGANFYVMQFGVGADVIYNITNVADGNLGVIAGLQVGGVYWLNSWYWWGSSSNQNSLAFDMALNIGVRWTQNEHVIEVLGKIPFIEAHTGTYLYSDGDKNEYYSKETFSFVARYMYRF